METTNLGLIFARIWLCLCIFLFVSGMIFLLYSIDIVLLLGTLGTIVFMFITLWAVSKIDGEA